MSKEHRPLFEELLDRLQSLGDVTGKAMFGGYGFWESGDMFALIDSAGRFHLKADERTVDRYLKAGAEQFTPHMAGRPPTAMPYWTVPAAVLRSDAKLLAWAEEAVDVGHATGRRAPASASGKRAATKQAKTSAAKKPAAKKPAAKQSVAKKSVAKKSVAKKSVAKTSVAKTSVARRPAAGTPSAGS